MTGQVPLPLRPEGAFPLGEVGCLTVDEAGGAVWLWGTLWWSWQAGDQAGRRLAAVQLAKAEVATRRDIAAAFGTSRETLWRWEQTYKERGVAGLAPAKPGPKGAWKLTDDIVERIVALDREGCTQAKIAATVGVSSFSVRQVLRARVPATTEPAAPPSDEADRTERELPVVPAPVPRTDERQAARFGQLKEAEPQFTQGRQLPLAGLLLALPTLEATGLLEVAETTYGKLKNGFYGLRSVLLTLELYLEVVDERS